MPSISLSLVSSACLSLSGWLPLYVFSVCPSAYSPAWPCPFLSPRLSTSYPSACLESIRVLVSSIRLVCLSPLHRFVCPSFYFSVSPYKHSPAPAELSFPPSLAPPPSSPDPSADESYVENPDRVETSVAGDETRSSPPSSRPPPPRPTPTPSSALFTGTDLFTEFGIATGTGRDERGVSIRL